ARRGQVRPDPAAQPGPAAAHRRGRDRRPAPDRRRLGQPHPGDRPGGAMNVAEAVGRAVAELAAARPGPTRAFGVVGSGNFHVTNALVRHGVPFVAARHEGGAITMADAYARLTGTVGVVSVHQGPGLTNAMT